MPCWTKNLVELGEEWVQKAMEKLGIKNKDIRSLSETDAERVKLEAGKLKMAAKVRKLNPLAFIQGMEVGSKKLTIRMEL